MRTPTTGRGSGRGRGGRGRGRRPRKTAESAVRGDISQLATYSARAPVATHQTFGESELLLQTRNESAQTPIVNSSAHFVSKVDSDTQHGSLIDGNAQGISAVSQETAVALIQKAIKETSLGNPENDQSSNEENKSGHVVLTHNEPHTSTPPDMPQAPTPFITQPSHSLTENTLSQADTSRASREDGLAVLSSSAISTQIFSNPQPQQHTNYEFHMHTPNSISNSLQGAGHGSGKGRGRKRKGVMNSTGSDTPSKRPRGRPKGSGNKLQQSADGVVKKRRGRKPKSFVPNTSHTMLQPIAPKDATAHNATMGVTAPPTSIDGSAGGSVIVSGEEPVNQTARVSVSLKCCNNLNLACFT